MYFNKKLFSYILFFTLFILVLVVIIIKNKNNRLDISVNQDNVNILEITNLQEIINTIPDIPPLVDFSEITPSHIIISDIGNEEWGLKVNKSFKKGELIHSTPISFFSDNYDTKIITPIGEKYIYKSTHSCIKILRRHMFAYCHTLLNHSYIPNCYYSPYFKFSNGQLYVSLFAVKDIYSGDELYINYISLLFFYIKLYISILFSKNINW